MEAFAITIIVFVFVITVVVILICQCKRGQKKGHNHSVIIGRKRPTVSSGQAYCDGAATGQTTQGGIGMGDGGAAIMAGVAVATFATVGGDGGGFGGGGCGGGGGGA